MRQLHWLVFDEYIPTNTLSSNPVYTAAQHNAHLAKHNQLGIQVIADNPTSSGNLYLGIEESCDGKTWVDRSGFATDINVGPVNGTPPVTKAWSDACDGQGLDKGPLLGFVRFKLFFGTAATAAHVKVYVTQRENHN